MAADDYEEGKYWAHSHGMEQFGLPDVECPYHDADRHDYFYQLVGDACLYMIENGPVLSIGDTAELQGDGVIFKVAEGSKEGFGRFGCLRLEQLP